MLEKRFSFTSLYDLGPKEVADVQELINIENARFMKRIRSVCELYGVPPLKMLYDLVKSDCEAIEEAAKQMGCEDILKD